MTFSWSKTIIDKYMAPGLVEFTGAEVPDLTADFPQAPYWLGNQFLNAIGRATYRDGVRQLVLGYVRRTYHAFQDYHSARALTLAYLDGNNPHNPRLVDYYKAVAQWEAFAIQASMAFDLILGMRRSAGPEAHGVFEQGDGSPEDRLNLIANQVKHLASCVRSGQCQATDTVPLWLTNNGLASFGVELSYADASAVLTEMAKHSEDLQDPLKYFERLRQMRDGPAESPAAP